MKIGKRSLLAIVLAVTAVLAFIGAASAHTCPGGQCQGRPGTNDVSAGGRVLLTPVAAAAVTPIPWEGPTVLPEFIGQAAKAHPLPPPQVPHNPFLAPAPFSNYHNDTWMSDTYAIAGPLGRAPAVWSSTLAAARTTAAPAFQCGALAFDKHDRIVTVCVNFTETNIVLVDPVSLAVLTWMPLPKVNSQEGGLATAYMILDNLDRAWVPSGNHIIAVEQIGGPDNTTFRLARDYDLSPAIPSDIIGAVTPDFSGRMWFVTRKIGIVGVLDLATGVAQSVPLGEEIANGFAVDHNDAYIVSIKKMYRFTAGDDNFPRVVWSAEYENVGYTKDGQYSSGSGTTPTILGHGEYVAIGDNAEQLHVVVFRTDERLGPNERRVVCQVPVFDYGLSGVEDSFIGLGRSIVLVNNYGAKLDPKTFLSQPSQSGVARVDIAPNGKSCDTVWTNTTVTPASYGAKLSTRTGLVYLFARKPDPVSAKDVWYWTAIDFRTGETVWQRLVGTGRRFDGYWPLGFLGPNGTAYMATFDGIVAIRDTP
jgi:hypothetical protein